MAAPSGNQQRALVQSLYAQLMAEFGLTHRFPPRLSAAGESTLVGNSVRDAKRRLRAALALALRHGAAEVMVPPESTGTSERRIGFV